MSVPPASPVPGQPATAAGRDEKAVVGQSPVGKGSGKLWVLQQGWVQVLGRGGWVPLGSPPAPGGAGGRGWPWRDPTAHPAARNRFPPSLGAAEDKMGLSREWGWWGQEGVVRVAEWGGSGSRGPSRGTG